jgi:hypothetical protein
MAPPQLTSSRNRPGVTRWNSGAMLAMRPGETSPGLRCAVAMFFTSCGSNADMSKSVSSASMFWTLSPV